MRVGEMERVPREHLPISWRVIWPARSRTQNALPPSSSRLFNTRSLAFHGPQIRKVVALAVTCLAHHRHVGSVRSASPFHLDCSFSTWK